MVLTAIYLLIYWKNIMTTLSLERLLAHREETYHLNPGKQLKNIQQAVDFVSNRGFVFFWPIKGIEYPSLWTAVAGPRPVANAHDDPGHVTWGWKDDSLGKRRWYYGKILRKRATMIDLEVAPHFYALSKNYGNPEEDILIQYHEGHLTMEAKSIFNAIRENGPLDTIAIRRATHMTSKESSSRFDRAMALLQSDFKILPIGISDSGGWRYAFIYDLVHRYYPEIPEQARQILVKDAYHKLASFYFKSVGAAQLRDIYRLFQWSKTATIKTLDHMVKTEKLIRGVKHPDIHGEWYAIKAVT